MTPHYIKVKVTAGARRAAFAQRAADSFAVSVREPAEAGRANAAVLAALSAHLQIPPSRLWIIKGAHQPSKIIEVRA